MVKSMDARLAKSHETANEAEEISWTSRLDAVSCSDSRARRITV